jgi:PhnB protein
MLIQPYLFFEGRCDEAALFYRRADGGQVRMPLSRTFFSSSFGMLADRFGVPWMVYVAP